MQKYTWISWPGCRTLLNWIFQSKKERIGREGGGREGGGCTGKVCIIDSKLSLLGWTMKSMPTSDQLSRNSKWMCLTNLPTLKTNPWRLNGGSLLWSKDVVSQLTLTPPTYSCWLKNLLHPPSSPLRYEQTVQDYNFGTLLRINCNRDYDQDNTMFGRGTRARECYAASILLNNTYTTSYPAPILRYRDC